MRLRSLVFAFAVLFASYVNSHGQDYYHPGPTQNPNAKRYAISGIVFNSVTNEPIPRALVRINSGQEQRVAFTSGDGRFQMPDVAEGMAWISAQRPGYFDACSVPNSPYCGSQSGQKVGPGTNDFRVALTPGSKISGTVLDTDGEPVEGLQVQVLGEQNANGRKQWMSLGSASTDDNGFYRLSEQQPGKVVICTLNKPLQPFSGKSSETYPPRCYPGGTDLTTAQAIDLAPGEETRADFTLSIVRGFNISGIITGVGQQAGIGVWTESVGGMQNGIGNFHHHPGTGQFSISGVPNGSWKFHFQTTDGRGRQLEAVEEISVNGADVTGLQISLQPGLDIPVMVNRQAATAGRQATEQIIGVGSPQNNGWVQVHLIPTSNPSGSQYYSSPMPGAQGEPGAQPSLAIQSIPPGSYDVLAQSPGNGCIGSISYGGADVSREPLTVIAGSPPPPLTVNIRNDCATLIVTPHSDLPETSGVLLLTSETSFLEPQILGFQGNQSMTVSNLSPGSYRLYAISDLDGLEYANPQAMREIPSEIVNLEPNGKTAKAITVLNRRRSQ